MRRSHDCGWKADPSGVLFRDQRIGIFPWKESRDMNIFLAVVFVCAGTECTFLQSQTTYQSLQACMKAAVEEVRGLKQANPQITLIDGACITVPMKGA